MHFVREILLRNVKYLQVCGFILFHLMHSIKFHNYKVNYFMFAVSKYFIWLYALKYIKGCTHATAWVFFDVSYC